MKSACNNWLLIPSSGCDFLSNSRGPATVVINTLGNVNVHLAINRITGETHNLLRNIKAAFTYLDGEMIKKLITSMIRPRLEYAALVWSPRLKKEIRKLERIQRAAMKQPETLRDYTYEERLERLGLTTLERRRERGDLIALYRIQEGLRSWL